MRQSEKLKSVVVQIVNGFVAGSIGGNPAGVVLDADTLDEKEMQAVAAKVGLSETAFVSASATEGFKLDFFTPTMRIAHCGHATIAAFSHLAGLGRIGDGVTSKETVDGPRRIVIKDGAAYMEQTAPVYQTEGFWGAEVRVDEIVASLGLTTGDLDARIAPMVVDTGNRFLVIGVQDEKILRNIMPDLASIDEVSSRLNLVGYYVFVSPPASGLHDATTRMFAPRYGIPEESATGMAAGPLACLLHDHLGAGKSTLIIDQGHFMTPPSPSLITVELEVAGGAITGLMAGGFARVSGERCITV